MTIQIGINGRFLPSNWRPAIDEIEFCAANGFQALQIQGPEGGLTEKHLGDDFSRVSDALAENQITSVLEITVRIGATGMTMGDRTPLDVLHANLPAVRALGCQMVHWHLVPNWPLNDDKCRALERALMPQFSEAARLGDEYGFRFSLKHNTPRLRLCATPAACRDLLELVPGLGFVWNFDHVSAATFDEYASLASYLTMLQITDTDAAIGHQRADGLELPHFLQTVQASGFSGFAILNVAGSSALNGSRPDSDQALLRGQQLVQDLIVESV